MDLFKRTITGYITFRIARFLLSLYRFFSLSASVRGFSQCSTGPVKPVSAEIRMKITYPAGTFISIEENPSTAAKSD